MRHILAPTPRDLRTRCARSGLRYFDQPEVAFWGTRAVGDVVSCPGCGRSVRLRETPWRVALIPRHARPGAVPAGIAGRKGRREPRTNLVAGA